MSENRAFRKTRWERWTLDRGYYFEPELVGTRLVHYYEVPSGSDLSNLGLAKGCAMPDRPDSGQGALAVIQEVVVVGKAGATVDVVQVTAFEPQAWE